MNQTKLVSLIKSLVTEAHHNMRYNYGKKKLAAAPLHSPDKSPQLAETKKIKLKKKKEQLGRTETAQVANKIETEPSYNSQMTAASGPKPQIDTK